MKNIEKAVVLLDYFTKTYCRKEDTDDLEFRCNECPFIDDKNKCAVKAFKCKYMPDYKDFGSMGDL